MNRRPPYAAALFLALLMPVPHASAADAYPDRPVRLVAGVPAGSGHDMATRALAEGLQAVLGQPFVVDNRAGADGIVAVRAVASARADGYTLLSAVGSQIAINPVTHARPGYDVQHDLVPVSMVARQRLMLAVHPSLPVTTVAELVAYARARPGTIDYASGGSTFMLATEALKRRTGIDMQPIPYAGAAPAMAALVGGVVQVAIATSNSVLEHAQARRIRVLAVSGDARLSRLPEVPTFAEAGIPDDVPVWSAVYAPAGTPPGIVAQLHEAIVRAVRMPAVRERLTAAGETVVASTPAWLAAEAERDTDRMRALAAAIGLEPE